MTLLVEPKKNVRERRSLKALLTEQELEAFTEAHGPEPQVQALSKIIRWFTAQDWIIRKQILEDVPEDYAADIAELVLAKMAKARPKPPGRKPPPTR